MTTTEQLQALAAEFWQWRAIHQPVTSDDLARLERPAAWQADWSAAAIERQRAQLDLFEERWRRMDPSGEPVATEVDHRLIGSALARVRWELDVTRGWQRSPKFYVDQTLVALFEALLRPAPFEQARADELIRLLQNIPRLLEDGRTNLAAEAVQPFAQAALAVLADVRPRLDRVRPELKPLLPGDCADRFDQALTAAIEAFETFRTWIEERLPSMAQDSAVGRDAYLFFLRVTHRVPLVEAM